MVDRDLRGGGGDKGGWRVGEQSAMGSCSSRSDPIFSQCTSLIGERALGKEVALRAYVLPSRSEIAIHQALFLYLLHPRAGGVLLSKYKVLGGQPFLRDSSLITDF